MSLSVEFFDRPEAETHRGARWTISAIDELVDVRVSWRRPKAVHEAQAKPASDAVAPVARLRYALPYMPRAIDGELPTAVPLDPAHSDDDDIVLWRAHVAIPAPLFWPMTIRVVVGDPGREQSPIAIRLIPRLSVLVSGLLMIAALLCVSAFGAFTLSSLSLTTSETITGVGSIALISAALAVARALGKNSWPHALPYLGIPYLLPRAIAAVCMGVVAVLLLLTYGTVSIHNGTARSVDIALPARDTDKLEPDATLTYARPRAEVVDRLRTDFPDLCVVDVWAGPRREDDCEPAKTEAKTYAWQRVLAPPLLELRCRRRYWPGLTYARLDSLSGSPHAKPEGLRDDDHVRLTLDDHCELPADLIADIEFENDDGGLEGHYTARYPWTPEAGARVLAVLGIDAAPSGVELEVSHEQQAGHADSLGLLSTAITVRSASSTGVYVPVEISTPKLVVGIGGSQSATFSTVECMRDSPRPDTHFRAIHVAATGDLDALLAVHASSAAAGWSSQWKGRASSKNQAWLCATVAGESSSAEAPQAWQTDKLIVVVDRNRLRQGLQLRVPLTWMAKDIEIRERELDREGSDKILGKLSCKPPLGESQLGSAAVTIGSLKNSGWSPPHGIAIVALDADLQSTWTDDDDSETEWSWGCWQSEPKRPLPATIESHDDRNIRSGLAHIDEARLAVQPPPLTRCWLHENGFFDTTAPPPTAVDCEPASPEQLRATVQARKVRCQHMDICSTPESAG